ncbi:hypothetical protein K227x_23270 [Rubripirellula lacrimiformis]|uniref:Uncharacterized protein n=1 Tax=Rubripirellula lacrimiformis TaxID=1930273 RepID=A0A517N9Y1_9BACT|nr:hypothetical protein K227x_23270 [Rubripirellula lacrimiformis]
MHLAEGPALGTRTTYPVSPGSDGSMVLATFRVSKNMDLIPNPKRGSWFAAQTGSPDFLQTKGSGNSLHRTQMPAGNHAVQRSRVSRTFAVVESLVVAR